MRESVFRSHHEGVDSSYDEGVLTRAIIILQFFYYISTFAYLPWTVMESTPRCPNQGVQHTASRAEVSGYGHGVLCLKGVDRDK